MVLRVFVVCQECHRQRELVVEGPEVAVALEHDCDAESGFVVREPAPGPGRQLTLAAS